MALADDVATLVGWLRRDILAVAGPSHAERCALYDFVVAELRARAPQCPHRLGPVCTYLENQRDAVLAFAAALDADLAAVAADCQVPVAVVRAVLHVQALDVRDSRRWPAEAALRQQLRGRFYELSAAVAAVARGTVRASSVVENLNSRLRNYFFLRRQLGPDYLHVAPVLPQPPAVPAERAPRAGGEEPGGVADGPAARPLAGVAGAAGSLGQLTRNPAAGPRPGHVELAVGARPGTVRGVTQKGPILNHATGSGGGLTRTLLAPSRRRACVE